MSKPIRFDMCAGLAAIGTAFTLGLDRVDGETVSAWKRRRRARKDYLSKTVGSALSDLRADEVWENMLSALTPRGGPTGLRAARSADVVKVSSLGVRLSSDLPDGVMRLAGKGILTRSDLALAERFRADYVMAYYSSAGMTGRYSAAVSGGGSALAVMDARASVIDARGRMDIARRAMSASCWAVLVQMVVYDTAQVDVSGTTAERYGSVKARRYGVGVLLTAALESLTNIYC